jgi:hypothetical protein
VRILRGTSGGFVEGLGFGLGKEDRNKKAKGISSIGARRGDYTHRARRRALVYEDRSCLAFNPVSSFQPKELGLSLDHSSHSEIVGNTNHRIQRDEGVPFPHTKAPTATLRVSLVARSAVIQGLAWPFSGERNHF